MNYPAQREHYDNFWNDLIKTVYSGLLVKRTEFRMIALLEVLVVVDLMLRFRLRLP